MQPISDPKNKKMFFLQIDFGGKYTVPCESI